MEGQHSQWHLPAQLLEEGLLNQLGLLTHFSSRWIFVALDNSPRLAGLGDVLSGLLPHQGFCFNLRDLVHLLWVVRLIMAPQIISSFIRVLADPAMEENWGPVGILTVTV